MLYKIVKRSLFLIPLLFVGNAYAQQNFTTSDVLGLFADVGTRGYRAETLTVDQAHLQCVSETNSGDELAQSFDADYYAVYKICMSTYVPFKLAGTGEIGSCSSESVSWGQCSATVPSVPEGAVFSARNTLNTDLFEGFASFSCIGGNLTFQTGGCSASVQPCDPNEVVNWEVTTPLWADESTATVFEDQFGQVRDTPKSRCVGLMAGALSGQVVNARPTIPEMIEPQNYDMIGSVAPKRCFNGEWLADSTLLNKKCEYIPKTCEARSYTNPQGCVFDFPSGEHDEIFISTSPLPQNSVGSTQAYCFDGEWEVKSTSCAVSCDATIPTKLWSSATTNERSCSHPSFNTGSRLAPGVSLSRLNEAPGMIGSASYQCINGSIVSNQSDWLCEPVKCEQTIGNYNWTGDDGSQCGHIGYNYNASLEFNGTLSRSSDNPMFDNVGQANYTCKFGELILTSDSCSNGGLSPACNAFNVTPDDWSLCQSIGINYGNTCCFIESGTRSCLKR